MMDFVGCMCRELQMTDSVDVYSTNCTVDTYFDSKPSVHPSLNVDQYTTQTACSQGECLQFTCFIDAGQTPQRG